MQNALLRDHLCCDEMCLSVTYSHPHLLEIAAPQRRTEMWEGSPSGEGLERASFPRRHRGAQVGGGA
jgi:hypothetical protein